MRPSTHPCKLLSALALVLLASGCASVPSLDPTQRGGGNEEATSLLDASVEAHGGDAYQKLTNIAVSYDGRWGRLIQRIQPVLTDTGYRKSSEERLLLKEGIVLQRHRGPEGVKTVERRRDGAEVLYFLREDIDGESAGRSANDEEAAASALVADAYEMFLLGPSFLKRRAVELERLPAETIEGRSFDRVLMRIEPGFGPAAEDLVMAWFDRENHHLFRVLFTLGGLESTQGAAVDVTFRNHRRVKGFLWPTHFFERVRAPLKIFAHEWTMTGLDLDRPLPVAESELADVLRLVERPAAPLHESPVRTATGPHPSKTTGAALPAETF